jgi:hypothetical protein
VKKDCPHHLHLSALPLLQGSQYVIKALADEVATGKYHGFVLNGDISCEWSAHCYPGAWQC